ncbi:MAG: DUF6580 family putative transport protein, partial [Bacteroidota bacterium]
RINIRLLVLLAIVLLMGLWRILNNGGQLTPLANFTPFGALALFGGAYFTSKVRAYFFPLLMLLVSDLVMMQTYFSQYRSGLLYDGWYWTYLAFALMVFVGTLIRRVHWKSVLAASVGAALIHYIVTDFGVWLGGGIDLTTGQPFTRDWSGLVSCYILALPFLKNMLLSNLLYSLFLFGGYELASRRYPVLNYTQLS